MNKIILKHKGFFNYSILNNLLSDFIQYVKTHNIDEYLFRKVQIVMVEIIENNYHYTQSLSRNYDIEKLQPEFKLEKTPEGFSLSSSNPVKAKDAEALKQLLHHINHVDLKKLKEEYKYTLKEGMHSEKSTAGIGLLRIAKVTRNKIKYSFRKIDNNLLYYTLEIMVNPK
ncbi:MAG: SiaB family protein kinase [Bacteroidetes bacterium]|nr:SiaB family protein kinase [Bacteroidota bacterium]